MSFMMIIQFLIVQSIFFGVLIFILKKVLVSDTEGAVNRLNRDTEKVRAQQKELNDKIKQANEELEKRKAESETLVRKMKEEAEEKAKEEREKIVNKARQEGEEIINKAQRTKDDIRKVIEKDMDLKAVDFTVLVLSDVLSQKASKALSEEILSEFIERLESVDMDMILPEVNTAGIVTATALEEKHKNRLNEILQKKLKRPIKIEAAVDPKIIAGCLLQFGSLKLNGSLQSAIRDMSAVLKDKIEKGLMEK
jgi:F-type H+-transporting ATPase subunit b